MLFTRFNFDGFQWDENKRSINLTKHGIDFLDAATIFEDPVLLKPTEHKGEARYITVGALEAILITVIITIRDDNCRIISARRARKNERREYRNLYPGRA